MSAIRKVFWNPEERRVRALWRLLLHLVALALIGVATSMVLGSLIASILGVQQLPSVAVALITASSIAGASWLCARVLDERPFAALGFHLDARWFIDAGAGAALGLILMAGIFGVELAAGWVEIEGRFVPGEDAGQPFALALALAALMFVLVGFYEELFSRGYQLRNLAEGLRGGPLGPGAALAVATLLSSTIFGLAHANNDGATTLSTINVALAGCMLAVTPLLTGELGFAVGLHASWNFCQGNVFGFPVSGTDPGPRVLALRQAGDPLLTGGDFGPEAGLLGVAAMILGAGLSVLWVRLSRGELRWHEAWTRPSPRETS
ncbi:CPBP family intramembrane metalloprotease [Pseudenhygromyxa sp. WMMC2535]|uniref:CPBP family intramembrane glutamic endopeptidase n=1 Tax=Pseudenhygromyxa sp. WMMC2535 TaxID=2712867 RepID=UPI0015544664|nr:type II CAAX endopeptidase family protein [Pseudenhygromyxa sp. WMMC2535]NVB38874.1 CPBP family intramembrane metalloprotease [Pseudenhygromyxa sp. WMMC2535]